MKLVLAAAAILLCLGQSYGQKYNLFTPGKEYHYEYLAHAISGLPDNSNQQAGIAMKGSVLVQAQQNSLKVKIDRLQTAHINEELDTVDLESLKYQWQSIGKDEHFITAPIKVNMKQGEVTDFETSADEPDTVTNIKKAILTALQLQVKRPPQSASTASSKMSPYSRGKYASMAAYKSQVDEEIKSDNNDYALYDVMEDDVAGNCKTTYIVSKDPWAGNPNGNVLNVTTIDDYEDCEDDDTPQWTISTQPPNNCSQCDADDIDPLNTVKISQYDIKIEQGNLVIERMESVAETVYTPLTSNSDEIHTNHTQILVLKEVKSISSPMPSPVNPERHEELEYDFPGDHGKEPTEEELQHRPLEFVPLDGKRYPQEVRRLVEEVAQDIRHNANNPMVDTPGKVLQLSRAWATLSRADVAQIYNELATSGKHDSSSEEAQTKRRVVLDSLLMSGTLPALSFAVSQMEKQEIQGEEANQALMGIAQNIRRPTAPFITKLQQLCEIPAMNQNKQNKATCWLTYASVMEQSCGDNDDSTLPVSPELETYCNDQQARRFIQPLASHLNNANRKEDQMLFVEALAISTRPEVLEVLRPYANGNRRVSEDVRVKAILALKDMPPKESIELTRPIMFNSNEPSAVRVAASIIAFQASSSLENKENLNELGALLSSSEDDQVASYIYSVFEQFANATHPCNRESSSIATQALSFAEDFEYGIQDSQINLIDDYDEDTDTGAILKLAWVASNDSLIPRVAHLSLKRTLAGFTQKPLRITAHIAGAQSVIDRTLGPKAAFSNLRVQDVLSNSYDEQPQNYHNLFKKLNIEPRDDEPLSINVAVQTKTTSFRMFHIDAQKVASAVEGAMLRKDFSELSNGIKINFQQITNFGSVRHQFPSSLGMPIVVNVQSPAVIDVKGKISAQLSGLPSQASVHATLKPTISMHVTTSMGVVDPFKKTFAAAGVTSKTFLTLPVEINVQIEPREAKLITKVKPLLSSSASNNAKIFSHKVEPFTVLNKYDEFQPFSKNAKRIMNNDKPEQYQFNIGKEVTGVPAQLTVKSDMFWQDQGSFLEYLFEDNSPLSHAMLWWATPDFKYREYQLTVDSNAASSTEVTTTVDLDYLPSRFQQLMQQGQNSLKGILGFALGWGKSPMQCEPKSHDASKLPKYQDGHQQEQQRNNRNNNDDDADDDNDNDDDDDDVNDNDDNNNNNQRQREARDQERQSRSSSSSSWSSSSSSSPSQAASSSVEKINLSSEDTVSELKVKVDVALRGPVSRSMHSTTTLSRNAQRMTDKLDVKVDIDNPPYTSNNKLQVCASASVSYPKLPCDIANSLNPDSVEPIKGHLGITYGQSCSSSSGQIKIDAVYSKTKEQKDDERQGKEWFFKQCESDYRAGRRISEACIEAVQAVGNLNKATYDIQYNNVPDFMVNASHKIDNFFKFYFYNQMTNNPVNVHNGEGHLKIVTTFDNENPTVDVKVFKANENTFFENVFVDDISEYLAPMNARQSMINRIADDLFNGDAPPTCKVMSNYIESFENVTYKAPLTNCKHVITKDCSPSDLFSVLMSKTGNGNDKELEVQLLQHRIVAQSNGQSHHGQFEVTIDGQKQSVRENQPLVVKSNTREGQGKAVASVMVVGEFLHIRAPHHLMWIKFDGQNAMIKLSNQWRGEVCGMCGDMTGDSNEPLTGPAQCVYADEKDFANAYAVPSNQCSAPKPSDKKICPDDDNNNNNNNNDNKDDNNDDDDNDDENDDNDSLRNGRSSSWSSKNRQSDAPSRFSSSWKSSARRSSSNNNEDDDYNGDSNNDNNDDNDDDDDDNNDDDDDDYSSNSNTVQRNVLRHRSGRLCFSKNPVPECKSGSHPAQTESRPLAFKCYNESSQMGQSLQSNRNQRPLRELQSSSSTDFTEMVEIPKSCRKN